MKSRIKPTILAISGEKMFRGGERNFQKKILRHKSTPNLYANFVAISALMERLRSLV